MSRKRYTPEQIISMLREAEVALAQGQSVGQACRTLGAPPHRPWAAPFSLSPPRVPLTLASAREAAPWPRPHGPGPRALAGGARGRRSTSTAVTTALSVRVARGACLGTLVSQGPLQRQFELLDLVGFLFVALPCLHASDGCDAGVAGGHLVVVLVAQGDRDMCVGGGGPRASPWTPRPGPRCAW